MTADQLRAAFLTKLRESGLTKADADRLGFRPYPEEEARQLYPGLPSTYLRDGFVLPYRKLDGKFNGFYRWRNLDRTVPGFAALAVGSEGKKPAPPPKYLQATGSCAEIFLPVLPNVECDWTKIAADVDTALLTSEGELKAACAVKHGLPAFAIGGVDMFSAKKQNLRMLKSFNWFQWKERDVYVILDSDAAPNPAMPGDKGNHNVRNAGGRYCSRLSGLGAHVYMVILPPLLGPAKTGLDDYLEHSEGGKDRLMELISKTEEWKESAELWAMNDEAIYVRQVSQVYILEEDLFLKPADFVNNYRPRAYTVKIENENKIKLEKKIVPKEWLGEPCRNECVSITFDPTLPPRQTSDGVFNMFPGLALQPKSGDLGPWSRLMDWMFAEEEKLRDWFTSWAAYPLQRIMAAQNPKMHSCVALISPQQGSGKGLVGETLGQLYGPAYTSITSRELRAEFNEWARNRLFVLGNEITDKGCADVAEQLKAMITESTYWLHPKYVKRIVQPNFMNYLFTSNHVDAFFLSFSDRRFFIHEAPDCKLIETWGRQKIDAYVAWRDSAEGQAALLYHLLEWKIPAQWDHRSPPDTPAKYALQAGSANQAENWLRDIDGRPEMLRELQERRLWTAEELLARFQQTTHNTGYGREGMGKALAQAGWHRVLRGRQIRNLHGYKLVYNPEDKKWEYRKDPIAKRPLWAPPRFAKEAAAWNTERAAREQFNKERKQKSEKGKS